MNWHRYVRRLAGAYLAATGLAYLIIWWVGANSDKVVSLFPSPFPREAAVYSFVAVVSGCVVVALPAKGALVAGAAVLAGHLTLLLTCVPLVGRDIHNSHWVYCHGGPRLWVLIACSTTAMALMIVEIAKGESQIARDG